MSSQLPILLKNGTVIEHGPSDTLSWRVADVLVSDRIIQAIAPDLAPPSPSTTVIDCTDKILTPGFIDTHNHVWQTALKGRHADDVDLATYMPKGNLYPPSIYSASDAYINVLAGALESLDAGTTSILDAAHITVSREITEAAARGLVDSGVRGVFAAAPMQKIQSWTPSPSFDGGPADADWFKQLWQQLADPSTGAVGRTDGRIRLGLSLDRVLDSAPQLVGLAASLSPAPALYTLHDLGAVFPVFEASKAAGLIDTAVASGTPIVVAHGNGHTAEEYAAMQALGNTTVSSTPSTELHMALGDPVSFDRRWRAFGSLGVDCHSHAAASLISELRVGLGWWRSAGAGFHREGRTVSGDHSIHEAFNLLTVRGATALGLGDRLGRLREGYYADVVVWDALSPAMVAGAQHDPVAAVVLNSSVRDVHTVLVDGAVRKTNGRLCDVHDGPESLSWPHIARSVIRSREVIQARIDELGLPGALNAKAGVAA